MKIAVLTGGAAGAGFLPAVKSSLGWDPIGPRPDDADDHITAVVTTAHDIRLHDLHISPDLDMCLYAACGVRDEERGWGRADESWTIAAELAAYGAEAPWFRIGDRDMATQVMRTRMMNAGYPLSAVTEAISARWRPGVDLLPMTDDRVESHIVISDPLDPGGRQIAIHVQEWWHRDRTTPRSLITVGLDRCRPAPGVIDAIAGADLVLIAPSHPVLTIGAILGVPGIRQAVATTSAPVIGFSPYIADVSRRAAACLALGDIAPSSQGVATHYGARAAGGVLDAFVTPEDVAVDGLAVVSAPGAGTDPAAVAELIRTAGRRVDVRLP